MVQTSLRLSTILSAACLILAACSPPATAPVVPPTQPLPTQPPATKAPPTPTPTQAPPTPIPPTPTSTTPPWLQQVSDGNITVNLDKVERTQDLGSDYKAPPAGAGQEYLVFHLSVPEINEGYLVNLGGYGKDRSTLLDGAGKTHTLAFSHFQGVKFEDPTNITSSMYFVAAAEGILVYQVPVGTRPESLLLLYEIKEDLAQKTGERGEMGFDVTEL